MRLPFPHIHIFDFSFAVDRQKADYRGRESFLKGTVPPELRHLTNLERFLIPDRAVAGPILEYLNDMPNLSTLSLASCNFTGSFPETFGDNHPYLMSVELIENQFTGTIPESFVRLASLNSLGLSKNQFKGPIPTGLGALPSLRK